MKASEARRLANETNTNATKSQYSSIMGLINKAVNAGEYEVHWYEAMNSAVKDKLREEGYTVGNTQMDRNETITKISW